MKKILGGRMSHSLFRVLAFCFFLSGVSSAFAQQEVILATTTSVQDTGLLDVIVPIFEQRNGSRVKAIAVGTGQALAMAGKDEADVVLAHAPDTEKKYVSEGVLVNRRLVMHNWFLLAGPAADPAKVKEATTAVDALKRIAAAKALFVSRGDDSGTHKLEKKLWEQAGITPTGDWYLEAGQGMGRTLGIAGEKQAYVISDRATYLAFQKTTGLAVLLQGDPAFLNLYHVLEVNSEKFPKVNAKGGKAFADFLLSPTVQDILKTFGVDKFGEPLFHPDAGRTEAEVLKQP
jgi:tungstate transport system substrate-binding protein